MYQICERADGCFIHVYKTCPHLQICTSNNYFVLLTLIISSSDSRFWATIEEFIDLRCFTIFICFNRAGDRFVRIQYRPVLLNEFLCCGTRKYVFLFSSLTFWPLIELFSAINDVFQLFGADGSRHTRWPEVYQVTQQIIILQVRTYKTLVRQIICFAAIGAFTVMDYFIRAGKSRLPAHCVECRGKIDRCVCRGSTWILPLDITTTFYRCHQMNRLQTTV